MSMSTPAGGGNRRPSITKPAAGAKPNTASKRPAGARSKPDAKRAAAAGADADAAAAEAEAAEVQAAEADAKPELTKRTSDDAAETPKASATRSSTTSGTPKSASGRTSARTAANRSAAERTAAKAGSRPVAGRPVAGRPGAGRPGAKGAGKGGGRKPITPVKVSQGRNWGPIALFSVVLLVALGIVGYMGWRVYEAGLSVSDRAGSINGVVNYKAKDPSLSQAAQHAWGPLQYPQTPPVGGKHNYNWQNCMGDVYDAQIANEHAVHSLEHGAVWVTYNPDKLSKADVDALAAKVRGKEYMLMSPYPGIDKPISLQAWGYQLKLDSATDGRIDEFIKTLRNNAGIEPGASCSGGITATGTTPKDLGKDQPQQPQQPQPGG
jgi:hypothetical protein